jgi:hypothetical protein
MTKPEGPFRFTGGGKNIVLFRGRKKIPGCLFPGLFGVRILNITSGSQSSGVLASAGTNIGGGAHHSGMGDTEIRMAAAKIGPSSGFGKNCRDGAVRGLKSFPGGSGRPIQFPQNTPAFGPEGPGSGLGAMV